MCAMQSDIGVCNGEGAGGSIPEFTPHSGVAQRRNMLVALEWNMLVI